MADHLKKKKIGLLGGTFDPIHIGHLNLACELREKGGLDEIWFIPTATSPFKQQEGALPGNLRYEMVSIALERAKEFRALEDEVKRGGVSYTIDTLRSLLQKKQENEEFTLCLAEDSVEYFHQWKEYQAILTMLPVLVGLRASSNKKSNHTLEIARALGMQIIVTTLFEVSATYVRERLKKRVFCDHLVPQKVLDFIYENQLYFEQ